MVKQETIEALQKSQVLLELQANLLESELKTLFYLLKQLLEQIVIQRGKAETHPLLEETSICLSLS
jgi:hypothetical protein